MGGAETAARRAAARLRRALEKCRREIGAMESALRHVEGADFPDVDYEEARRALTLVGEFLSEEERRLKERILLEGGLEPGRIRRSSSV